MRKLIVIARTKHVRTLIESGALDEIDDHETYWVASKRWVTDKSVLERKPGYLGAVDVSQRRLRVHERIRKLLLFWLSRGSRVMRIETETSDAEERRRLRLESLPLVRQLVLHRLLRRLGLNKQLHRIVEETRPDIVIAPSAGVEELALDAVQSARELGIPSLMLIPDWDSLSKGSFGIKADYLGVWGDQCVEQAQRIHGIPKRSVTALGAPWLDPYFNMEPGSTRSHFPFPYALFAGCLKPFDERTALEALDRVIEERGLDLKIVYRPHPARAPRKVSDFVDESDFHHVVIDPEVREAYPASFGDRLTRGAAGGGKKPLPALDYHPALLEHARFVVCPLSATMVEVAIFERRVIGVAYDDGIHGNSPDVMVEAAYFEGVDSIEGFEMARTPDELPRLFAKLATSDPAPPRLLREQIGWWLHHDERPYARRVADLVDRIGEERGLPRGPSPAPRPPARAARDSSASERKQAKREAKQRHREQKAAREFDPQAEPQAEWETLARHRIDHLVEVREPLALISQIQRSGGTLLSQLFDGHPQLHAHPYELHTGSPKHRWPELSLDAGPDAWFQSLWERPAGRSFREGYRKEPTREGLVGEPETFPFLLPPLVQKRIFDAVVGRRSPDSLRAIFDCYMTSYFNGWLDNQSLYTGDKRWVVAFAARLSLVEQSVASLFDTYPDGRLISIVRDPRSWYVSARRHAATNRERDYGTLEDAVRTWSRSAEAMLDARARYGERFYGLTFESLLGDTEATMRDLAAFLGIDFLPILREPSFNGMPIRANSSFVVADHGVVSEPLERHRRELTPEELSYLEQYAVPLYERVVAEAGAGRSSASMASVPRPA